MRVEPKPQVKERVKKYREVAKNKGKKVEPEKKKERELAVRK